MLKLCCKHNDHNNNYKDLFVQNMQNHNLHEFNTESEAGTTANSDSLSRYFRCVNLFINELCNKQHNNRIKKTKMEMHV